MKTQLTIILFFAAFLIQAQNVMTYQDRVYNGDTIVLDTFTCNITQCDLYTVCEATDEEIAKYY